MSQADKDINAASMTQLQPYKRCDSLLKWVTF